MTSQADEHRVALAIAADAAAVLIDQADFLLIAAGAGMGVDSGLPDFRGQQGFWRAYPAIKRGGMDFSSIASPEAFRTQPLRAWGFYGHRLALYRRTVPHPAFAILRRWGEGKPTGYAVFTSNVDGQFQAAGFPESVIDECHGSIHRMQCTVPCSAALWSADAFMPATDDEQCILTGPAPVCPHCGALARPNILMFGDVEWIPHASQAQHARLMRHLAAARRPVVVEIGAGTAIPSVRRFSEAVARQPGGRLIRINRREAEVDAAHDIGMFAGGLDAIEAIDAVMKPVR